jgi:hypothetical protein
MILEQHAPNKDRLLSPNEEPLSPAEIDSAEEAGGWLRDGSFVFVMLYSERMTVEGAIPRGIMIPYQERQL